MVITVIGKKAGIFYGQPFKMGIGVTQGDTVSPAVFNIVVNAVVRALLVELCGQQEANNGIGWAAV